MAHDIEISFFCRQKKLKILCRKHNRTTDTESDRNPENNFHNEQPGLTSISAGASLGIQNVLALPSTANAG